LTKSTTTGVTVQRVGRFLSGVLGILALVLVFFALEQPAHAYADPGSGLLLLQVGSSMLAGAVFFLRARLRKLFRLGRTTSEETVTKQP
jgi:hypothetical protein